MGTPLTMSNRAVTPVQHRRPPINPVDLPIHRTTHHPLRLLTLKINPNPNPTTHHNLLMEGRRARSQLTVRRQTPNNRPTEASNTKTLMEAINLSSTLPLLTSSHLTAPLQIRNNHHLEVFSTKIRMAAIKGHRPCSMRRPRVTKQLLDTAPLHLVTSHSHNTSTFKVCTMRNTRVDYMATVPALMALPYLQAPTHTRAKMHLHNLSTVRPRTSMVDSRGGDMTI